jgi:hypothetical protein
MEEEEGTKTTSFSPLATSLSIYDAVERLLLTSLVPPDCYLPTCLNGESASTLSRLGLGSPESRKKINSRRYRLKLLRDEKYDKFVAKCDNLQVPCPKDNKWLKRQGNKASQVKEAASSTTAQHPSKMSASKQMIENGESYEESKSMMLSLRMVCLSPFTNSLHLFCAQFVAIPYVALHTTAPF